MPRLESHQLLPILARFPVARRGWVAFSGGLDSTVLLHALAGLRSRLTFELRAVHVNHGLQVDAAQWARHCRRVCNGLGVPLASLAVAARAAPGESPEAAARAARYGALAGLIQADDLVLAAHHQDDQAETLLLALLRGSGVHGLAAMPVDAPLGSGRLVRPLLGYRRRDLHDYAIRAGLTWIEDPSNAALDLDRNLLRHEVLPRLRERWPSAPATIARSAAHCAEAARIVDNAAADLVMRLAGGDDTLSIPGLRELPTALCRAALRYWVRDLGLPVPDQVHLERVLREVLSARRDADPLVAWPGTEIRRYRERLFALRPLPPRPAPDLALDWWPGSDLRLPAGLGRLVRPAVGGDDAIVTPLKIRFAVPGARLRPYPGAQGRSLKTLFQEAGIPPWLRPYIPLVFAGDDLIAVPGLLPNRNRLAMVWLDHPWQGLLSQRGQGRPDSGRAHD
ncbi:tRNA(Ile)-lysidine synthetase [Thioflavicoccus mobilis 8321]|uniref:tRNA(Ile)-lysidine synthase n=1 Tax=Thioflavicoccus mobilis 8321 TaxID=765912 RepID=L0GWM0_9GAMM|nr:tRNA lysidine(34) synthetase TilS [Thioflavicoccus mobilis]AGA89765.1 tRNA(Ile)-lysidine synthetase [Thioflavicoccus mobilis 8321]